MGIDFLQNKYTVWYLAIVARAKERKLNGGYTERHHILPKSLGGSNLKTNIVCLTGREHFICHVLLPKMLQDSLDKRKMYYALHRLMFSKSPNHGERYLPPSRRYEQLRTEIASGLKGRIITEETRAKLRGRIVSSETRAKFSKLHKGKIVSLESRAKMSIAHLGIPNSRKSRTKEQCENISKGKIGKSTKWSTPENREAVSRALKGRKKTPEHLEAIAAAQRGTKRGPRAHPSPLKGIPLTEEVKAKMRKPKSEEMKRKLREFYAAKRAAKAQ